MATQIIDLWGNPVDFDETRNKMDPNVRRLIDNTHGDADPQAYFEAYCAAHELKHGEEFDPR